MKRGVCFLMAVLLTAALMGCGNSGGLPCEVLSGVFSYNIEGEMSGVTVCGRVFADAPRECDGNQLRRVGIVYSAPEALRGITAACDSFNPSTHETGGVTLTLDGMTVNNAALDGLITPALLLAATFEEVSVTAAKKDRRSWTTVVSQANGNRRSVTFIDATLSHFEGQFHGCSGSWRILP